MRARFCLLALLTACSSGAGNPLATSADYDAQSAILGCAHDAKCGAIAASELKACQAGAAALAAMYPPAYTATEAVKSKRLAYSAKAATTCLAAFKTVGCNPDLIQATLTAAQCFQIYTPLVAVGGACFDSGECIGGYCDQGMGGSGCMGTCKAFLATGAACDPTNPLCGGTDFCDATAKVCTAALASGAACSPSVNCAAGLFCKGYQDADTTTMTPEVLGACKGPGAVGDVCSIVTFGGNTDCTPGLYCDFDTMPSPTCAATVGSGVACSDYAQCSDGLDCAGIVFDANDNVTAKGVCQPFLDGGAACTPSTTADPGCAIDMSCDATSKTCVLTGPLGADCSATGTNDLCATNLYCDGPTMKCTAMLPLGAACVPPVTDSMGNQTGDDPCHDGACDATAKTCTNPCM